MHDVREVASCILEPHMAQQQLPLFGQSPWRGWEGGVQTPLGPHSKVGRARQPATPVQHHSQHLGPPAHPHPHTAGALLSYVA